MKRLSSILALAALAISCNNAPSETVEVRDAADVTTSGEANNTYTVITDGDEIQWEGYKTYADSKHNGTLQVSQGELDTRGHKLLGGSFIIDMNSISSVDMEGEYKAKLENHLKGPDFFDVADNPTATFTITEATPVENGENGTNYSISGNLKMRGVEKNITFPAVVTLGDEMLELSTPEFVINRTDWKVMYKSNDLGSVAKDQLIDNSIKLKVDLKAKKA